MAKTEITESSFHTGVNEALPITAEATTSRLLVDNGLHRIVMFTMGEGQELTEHASPRAATVLVQEGTLDLSVGDDRRSLVPGDVVYMAPNAPHALVATGPCRFTLVMVEPPAE